jgi:hypothetical protein
MPALADECVMQERAPLYYLHALPRNDRPVARPDTGLLEESVIASEQLCPQVYTTGTHDFCRALILAIQAILCARPDCRYTDIYLQTGIVASYPGSTQLSLEAKR